MRQLVLTTLTVLVCVVTARATHVLGADIRYEFDGSKYRVYLTLYGECGGAWVGSTPGTVSFQSTCGNTFSRPLPLVSADTLRDLVCPNTLMGGCSTSANAMWIAATFSDTVGLAPCASWKMSYTTGNRNSNIVNIQNPLSYGLYVEAFLNNLAAPNSSFRTSSPGPFLTSVTTPSNFPLHGVEGEGDSVTYELIGARTNGDNPLQYSPGYSVGLPLGNSGGVSQINAAASLLRLTGTSIGSHVLVLRTRDYRNGTLVGYTERDWTVVVGSSTVFTIPQPASSLNVTTCPGQSHTYTFTFQDSTLTDTITASLVSNSLNIPVTMTGGTGVGSANAVLS